MSIPVPDNDALQRIQQALSLLARRYDSGVGVSATGSQILADGMLHAHLLLDASAIAILCPDNLGDFSVVHSHGDEDDESLSRAIDHLIDEGLFGWALNNNRATISPFDGRDIVLQVISTTNDVIGMVMAFLPPDRHLDNLTQTSLTIVINSMAERIENSRLLARIEEQNRNLELEVLGRTQAYQEERDKAEIALRAKSEFLAVMSHEIRTPMNGMLGMAQLLGETELTVEQREFIETICESGNALLGIINDILDFSKIESGKLDLEQQNFDLWRLAEDVSDLLAPTAHDKNIELYCDIAPDANQWVIGDSGRIRQILLNITSNAIKFTSEGSVTISLLPDVDGSVRAAISDTGIGITEEQRVRLFAPFSQADSSTTRKFGGTGLGLVICKKLIDLMHGGIDFISEVGQGTTFFFQLPLPKGTEPSGAQVATFPGKSVYVQLGDRTSAELVERQLDHVDMQLVTDATRAGAADLWISDDDSLPHLPQLAKHPPLLIYRKRTSQVTAGDHLHHHIDQVANKPIRTRSLMRWIEDALSQGERIPVRQKPITHTLAPASLAPILIAEDNPTNSLIARKMLEKHGYQTLLAEDGQQAHELFEQEEVCLILMDCQMPIMDGYQTTHLIKSGERWADTHTPIIALTANAMDGDREKCLAAGMDDFIAKPIKKDVLLTKVDYWSNRSGSDLTA